MQGISHKPCTPGYAEDLGDLSVRGHFSTRDARHDRPDVRVSWSYRFFSYAVLLHGLPLRSIFRTERQRYGSVIHSFSLALTMSFSSPLTEPTLHPDPIVQFQRWFDDAAAAGIAQANAMTLATASRDGRPSARIVLLKRVDPRGFEFFTNYESRKGVELRENPHAALVFHWEPLGRQVRVEGETVKISPHESDAYFRARPVEHQIGAWASAQSAPVTREELDRGFEETKARFAGTEVPRPPYWGGFRLTPHAIEFWQERLARLHDRIRYDRQPDRSWRLQRLSP